MSFLLLFVNVGDGNVLGLGINLCICSRLCSFIITRLSTNSNDHHIHILGQDGHRCSEGSKLVTLVVSFCVAIFALVFTNTVTTSTTLALFPTISGFGMVLANTALLGGQQLGPLQGK